MLLDGARYEWPDVGRTWCSKNVSGNIEQQEGCDSAEAEAVGSNPAKRATSPTKVRPKPERLAEMVPGPASRYTFSANPVPP